LSSAAPNKGTAVTLSSSDTSVATVPASVTVPGGSWSTTFPITVPSRTTSATATITATCSNNSQQLLVIGAAANVPTLVSIGVDNGNTSSTVGITLNSPAPPGGAVVTLTGSRDNIVNVPSSVTVPAGATSARAGLITLPYLGTPRGTIVTATYNGVSLWTVATENPQSARLQRPNVPQCASLAVAPCLAALPVTATATGDTTGYLLYTPEMQLLAETAVTAAAAKPIAYSYLWFAGSPVAAIDAATDTTRWYMTDHLGTPLLMTDSSGGVAWRAEYDPYGSVFALRTGATLHQPLRFPGQIAEDGVEPRYNVFRWYRSDWGRYTQADPIDFLGGFNFYGYATGNPIMQSDRTGLVSYSIASPTYVPGTWDDTVSKCGGAYVYGCTSLRGRIGCNCACSGATWRASVRVTVTSHTVYYATNASIAASLIRAEEQKHVDENLRRLEVIRIEGERIEQKKYPLKALCQIDCTAFEAWGITMMWFSQPYTHMTRPHPYH
jgi:RHS repeat-associated protein